jgi:hypothetical protein
MKRHVAMVTVATVLVMLLSSSAPVQAASPDDGSVSAPGPSFHALNRLSHPEQTNLTPLTNAELDSITGMAGWGLGLNLGIVVQINICAVCSGVTQINFGGIQLGLLRASARR